VQSAEERAAVAAHRLDREGVTVEHAVVQGQPARALAAEAASIGADLIIVGNRGRGGVASALLGSVSADTIDEATVAVLVARSATLGRILAADDGSDAAAHAIDSIRRWPLFKDAAVDVVSVCPPDDPFWSHIRVGDAGAPIDDPLRASPERRQHFEIANQTARRLQASGHPAEGIVEQGQPAERIVRAASQQHDDLIVMGTHRYSGLERVLQGSVSRSVLTHAKCSVLVVQPPDLN
jgi:nucleotide-binding universal stress UspA family protein